MRYVLIILLIAGVFGGDVNDPVDEAETKIDNAPVLFKVDIEVAAVQGVETGETVETQAVIEPVDQPNKKPLNIRPIEPVQTTPHLTTIAPENNPTTQTDEDQALTTLSTDECVCPATTTIPTEIPTTSPTETGCNLCKTNIDLIDTQLGVISLLSTHFIVQICQYHETPQSCMENGNALVNIATKVPKIFAKHDTCEFLGVCEVNNVPNACSKCKAYAEKAIELSTALSEPVGVIVQNVCKTMPDPIECKRGAEAFLCVWDAVNQPNQKKIDDACCKPCQTECP